MINQKTQRKRLFLIDGYALLYRAHFAFIRNPLITSFGMHTSALFGFTNNLLTLLRRENPDYIAAVFDTAEKTFRHKKFPAYKATREKMPDELREQLPHLWDILNAMQITTLSKHGFEADDVIGTLARWGQDHDLDVYIVSGDKDFMQLVNHHIFMYSSKGRNMETSIVDHDAVIEKWGVPPNKIIDLLGLMGDSSDNVPGVAGVGKVSAKKLILEYGSLEAALDNAEKVGNKRVREGLLNNRDNAVLSKELVTIDVNVELDSDIHELERSEIDSEAVAKKFTDLEFTALLKQVADVQIESVPQYKEPVKAYNTILNIDELKSTIKSIKRAKLVSVDLETTSTDPMIAEIVGISFSVAKDSGFYIPIQYLEKEKNNFGDDDLTVVLSELKPILENPNIPKTGQNIKYDSLIFKRFGIEINGIVFDTMIAAHVLNHSSVKLDNLALEHLNYQMIPIEELIGKGKKQISMAEVELEKAAYYAVEDADIAMQLTKIFQDKLRKNDLTDFYNKVELPLVQVLEDMEYDGVYVDEKMLVTMSAELGKQLDGLIIDIYKEAGTEFNINSTQQLAQILFDIKGLRQIKKRSTAESVLQQLKNDNPLPVLMLEYRKLNKIKNTYLDPFPELINPQTKRIHSNFSQTVAATGRLASSNPNFQNIPIRTDIGREMRKAFKAQKDGWKILSADYSQIELRIMAHLSQDSGLLEAFQNNEDIHARTAAMIFGVPIEDVLPEMRRTAKVVNFGIMYGAGPFRMSQELSIPRSEAQAIIETYFKQYAGIQNYVDATMDFARENKYVETMLGRRRPVWNIESDNHMHREAAKRMAINMPIQGTAAEMIKLAMIEIHKQLADSAYRGAKMILQIHDELLFEAPPDTVESLAEMVVKTMENALPLSVPVVVDWGSGNSWYEAH